MKFEKGNKFGSRSKRGQAKITIELKERLKDLQGDVYEAMKQGIKEREFQYIKLWFEYYYGKPKQSLDVKQTNIKPLEISFNYTPEEKDKRIKELIDEYND